MQAKASIVAFRRRPQAAQLLIRLAGERNCAVSDVLREALADYLARLAGPERETEVERAAGQ